MPNLLLDLWDGYFFELPAESSAEQRLILDRVIECEKLLNEKLPDELKKSFHQFDDGISKVTAIAEREAFVKGVRVGVRFIMDALQK